MQDPLQFFTVKIAGGSGCLFQPLNSEYSYVLTSKHVVEKEKDLVITRQYVNEDGEILDDNFEIQEGPFYHQDLDKDAAIIKIGKVDGLETLIRSDLLLNEKDNWFLCGYPKSRDGDKFLYRKNRLDIVNPVNGYIEGEIIKNVSWSEIVGQSGGGILKSEGSYFLLAGIQACMVKEDDKESLSRIHFVPLSFFDEIIKENSDRLTPLFAPYIGSFTTLLEEIFPFPNLLIRQKLIRNTLLVVSKEICSGISPGSIIEKYGKKFLVNGTGPHIIYHKALWKSLLEFLTIIKLHENSIDLNDFGSIHKKRQMLIVDTDMWTKKLEEIYKSDLSEIESGGSIVICATKEPAPTRTEILSSELAVLDISTPMEDMNISNTVTNPFIDLKLVNLFRFQEHIIKNAFSMIEINSANSKETIKQLTNGVI
jgi:hypothetical protein